MVIDPHTNNARPPVANTQRGPITIHCAAKLSAQCINIKWRKHLSTAILINLIWFDLILFDIINVLLLLLFVFICFFFCVEFVFDCLLWQNTQPPLHVSIFNLNTNLKVHYFYTAIVFVSKRRSIYPRSTFTRVFYRATLCVSAVFAVGLWPSICPSVTIMYRSQTAEDIVKLLFWPASSIILFFTPTPAPNSKGNPFNFCVRYTGVGKISDFRLKSLFISETVRDRPIVATER